MVSNAVNDMEQIVGQKAVVTKARRAVAAFKIREGFEIGCMVTLRRNRMYEFLDRLIAIAIPRIRDFRGLPAKSFLTAEGIILLELKNRLFSRKSIMTMSM